MNFIKNDERGMVSLVTTIIISILLCIIVISMVGIMSTVLKQSTDAADSIVAYYASEAGIEDAIYQVELALFNGSTLPNSNTCTSSGSSLYAGGSMPQYTCQTISMYTNNLTGQLAQDGTPLQIDLAGATAQVDHITISWNESVQPDGAAITALDAPYVTTCNTSIVNLRTAPWTCPAMLEITTVPYASVSNGVTTYTGTPQVWTDVVDPSGRVAASYPYNYDSAYPFGANTQTSPLSGACTTSVSTANPYNCQVTITGYSYNNYILRLKSVLAGTHYLIQAYDSSGNLVSLPSQFEQINVTARVGLAYRQVEEMIPVASGAANLDYVLFADNGICKNYSYSAVPSYGTNGILNNCP